MDCLKPLRAHKHPIAPPRLSTASKPIEPRVTSKKDTVLSRGVSMGGRPERHPLKSSSRAMEAGRSIQVRIEHARYHACERNRRRGTIADREAGGDPSAGLKGISPPMRMCSAPRHIDAAGRPRPVPGINGVDHHAVVLQGSRGCGATQSMARGHALTCAIKGRQP